MKNTGEIKDSYTFSITGNYQGWTATLDSPQVTLGPGEENTISLTLREDPSATSYGKKITVVITVKSMTYPEVRDSATIEGKLKEDDDPGMIPFPRPSPTAVVIGTAGMAAFFAAVGIHEPWKYRFFSLLIPLYTRTTTKVDSEARGEIMGYLSRNPGAHYNRMKRDLGFWNGKLAYHLKVLEDKRRIKSNEDGNKKRFYPREHLISKEIREKIIEILTHSPGLNQKDLVRILKMSRRNVGRKLNELVENGKVRIEKVGRKNHYFVVENGYTLKRPVAQPITKDDDPFGPPGK